MALTIGHDFDDRFLKSGGLAFAEGIDRSPHGDYGRLQAFSRTGSQNNQAAESSLFSQVWPYGIDSCCKIFDFSREDNSFPDSRVHIHLRAGKGERWGNRCYAELVPK